MILKESHCFYVVKDMTSMPTCYKGDDLPKGFLFFEVNDVNPLNALTFELEDGRLLWDVVCLFSGNINHHADRNAPFLSLNPQTQYWMDNNEAFIQPLRKRGIKVIMCVLGNHDQSGVAQLSDYGCQMFAKELATFCETYNIDGVCFDDEYSNAPDLSNPYYASRSSARPVWPTNRRRRCPTSLSLPIATLASISAAGRPRSRDRTLRSGSISPWAITVGLPRPWAI